MRHQTAVLCRSFLPFALLVAHPGLPAQAVPAQQPAPTAPPPTAPGNAGGATPMTPDANGVYTLRRNARIVILDVVVTDKQGNLVKDLKREDFHITEAKEDQAILNFEETGSHLPDASTSIGSTAELDRIAPRAPVNIILLDEFNTRFEDMAFARYSLKKFLAAQSDKLPTPTMLLAVTLKDFTVLRDYTQDKGQLLDALEHHFVAYPWQAHQYAWVAERYGTAFATLMRVAEATEGHPGHKNMIWIGRGFPALNFASAPVDTENRVNSYVQQCVNMLRDARITLYTIDPAGLQVTNTYGSAAAFNDPFGGNYQFSKLATATGGKALYGRNDVDAEIATTVRDGASFYTLSYHPSNTSMDPQKFRRIRITLTRPDLIATTREGYYLHMGPGLVNPEKPSRRLAFDLISAEGSNMVYDAVPMTVHPSANDPNAYNAHIEGSGLVWTFATETNPRHADLILMTSTFDKKGKELNRKAQAVKISAPRTVPPTGRIERPVEVPFQIDHDPKAVRARVVVRVTQTGRLGTADLALGQAAVAAQKP